MLRIRDGLQRFVGPGRRYPSAPKAAEKAGIDPERFKRLAQGRADPDPEDIEKICRALNVGVEQLLGGHRDCIYETLDSGVGWRLGHELSCEDQIQRRDVTIEVLRGVSKEKIAKDLAVVRATDLPNAARTDDDREAQALRDIGWMVRGALELGLVDIVLPDDPFGCCDRKLGEALSRHLTSLTPDGHRVDAWVVPSVAASDFNRDPVSPHLAARIGHQVVRRFLDRHADATHLGLAGGVHVGAWVGAVRGRSWPLPSTRTTDRGFTLLPLTYEPFQQHSSNLSDALVGEFARRAIARLGPRRIHAPSVKPIGFLSGREVGPLDATPISVIRQSYHRLDVAIFGCGNEGGDGWLRRMRAELGQVGDDREKTDVCLNLLDAKGQRVPLPLLDQNGRNLELLGVDLDIIRGLAAHPDRLALLLGTGPGKGMPMQVIARAGALNAVVCDQAAARACLKRKPRKKS